MSLIETLRGPRVGQFAIFDFALAFGSAWLLAPRIGMSRKRALAAVLPLGVVVHRTLGVDTPLTRMVLDRNGEGSLVAKTVVGASAIAMIVG